ncbi:MAG: hypothetical protein WDZ93_02695 [Candidatus Paceibacterota bacterium]
MLPKFSEMTGMQKAVFGFVCILVLAILGPVLGMAAFAMANLVVIGVYAAIVAGAILFSGSIIRIMKTLALKLAKANARMNPIETLELDYQQKRNSLDKFVSYVQQMMAAHKVSQDELNDLKREFPNEDVSDRQEMMDRMKNAVSVLRTKAGDAEEQLQEYHSKVRFMKADHKWAQRASGAMRQLKNVSGDAALDEILKGEAIGAVRQSVADSFAELEMLLEKDADTQEVLRLTYEKDPGTDDNEPFQTPHFFDNKQRVLA